MLRSKLNDALKHSVKNKDKIAVSTLRLILAALKDRDIAHRTVDADDDGVGEPEILKLLQSMIKQRKDASSQFNEANRIDLADKEIREINMLSEYLPEQISENGPRRAATLASRNGSRNGSESMTPEREAAYALLNSLSQDDID